MKKYSVVSAVIVASLSLTPFLFATGPSDSVADPILGTIPPTGMFSVYFQNMINTPCSIGQGIVGFNGTIGINYGKPDCAPIDGIWKYSNPGFLTDINYMSGSVGIGTATPLKLLDVQGDALINFLTIGRGGSNIASNTAIGFQSIRDNISGQNNTSLGYQSLSWNTAGSSNTAIGMYSLRLNATGSKNIALGYAAGTGLVSGSSNIAIGTDTSFASSNGSNQLNIGNTIYGLNIGQVNPQIGIGGNDPLATLDVRGDMLVNGITLGRGAGNDIKNTAFGSSALMSNTTGIWNTALGERTLLDNTTGQFNTAVGQSALRANTNGSNNVALGGGAMMTNTTGYNNTALGTWAMLYGFTGYENTAVGHRALESNSGGNQNVAVGKNTFRFNTIGSLNTILGYNSFGSATAGDMNIGIGSNAGVGFLSGSSNIAIGSSTSFQSNTGSNQLNIGNMIYGINIGTASGMIGIGKYPKAKFDIDGDILIDGLTLGRGGGRKSHNSAFGSGALGKNVSGNFNSAFGESALANSTTSYNLAIGQSSLWKGTGGTSENTGLGNGALMEILSGRWNTAVGLWSMLQIKSGEGNVALGFRSLGGDYVTGNYNTAIGTNSMKGTYFNGSYNVGIGQGTLLDLTGSNNIAIGSAAGGGLVGPAGINNTIIIGQGVAFYSGQISNSLNIGNVLYGNGLYNSGAFKLGINVQPTATLDINGTLKIRGGSPGSGKILISDLSGGASWTTLNKVCPVTGSGANNICYGDNSLIANPSGSWNTAVGNYTLSNNTTGKDNLSLGYYALNANTTGNYNVGIGSNALRNNTTGGSNVAIGYFSLAGLNTGYGNIALGVDSLQSNSAGNYNIGIGNSVLSSTTSDENIGIGVLALTSNKTGNYNIGIGGNALYYNTIGSDNVVLGRSAAQDTLSSRNSVLGNNALRYNTGGSVNTAIGYYAMQNNRTGDNNVALGAYALRDNIGGSNNVALGHSALQGIGSNVNSQGNIGIGYSAGWNISGATSNNIAIGNNVAFWTNTGSDQLNIGNWIYGNGGNIGIGNGNPSTKLDVNGQIRIRGGSPGSGKLLVSDTNGLASWEYPLSSISFTEIPGYARSMPSGGSSVKYTGFSITFPDYGTYSLTVTAEYVMNAPLNDSARIPIIQLLPANDKNLWGANSPRFAGSYEIYGVAAYPNKNTIDYRFYLSENITVDATTGKTAYLFLGDESTVGGGFYIGKNASAGCPQCTGGSYVRIK